ncbi:uncharacterized protein LOC120257362 isoform X1 [Dioscorea cayenensis subsp. rotundata]|uniref:Uncharacterized protein LOC120257362 isoform X1 n=1 Tax=Dioscorea cayennensis subsp. rotundata TaxID=55577 RepID=A0AB40B0T3_DIOCR|nr:uncharacterized protein LOC120257362 isoform X1 [Dioscorea cayenensis subsp. rotundata]
MKKKYTATLPAKRIAYSPDISSLETPGKVSTAVTRPLHHSPAGSINNGTHSTNSQPFRRISFQEMQVRKAKGLCFNCDEKFTPSHRCVSRRLLLLQWDTEPPEDLDPGDADFIVDLDSSQIKEEATQKLALNAMNSATLSGILRFSGTIKGHPVNILLDGGSDDNFIQPRIAQLLHLDVQPTSSIKVMVGNGHALQVEGYIPDLSILVQGNSITLPVYVLPIAGAEIILGAAWLATLGHHMVDYNAKFIQFHSDMIFIKLQGETNSTPHVTLLNQLQRLHTTNSIAEYYIVHEEGRDQPP